MPANLRSQLAAAFGTTAAAKSAELLVLYHTTTGLYYLVEDVREELDVSNNSLACRGYTPRSFDGREQLGRSAEVKTTRVVHVVEAGL